MTLSPALSISLDLDEDGNAEAVDVQLTTVRVQRLTYTQAQDRLDAGEEPFATLARLAAASRQLRVQEGALSIDLPEVRVKADEAGATVTPLPKPRATPPPCTPRVLPASKTCDIFAATRHGASACCTNRPTNSCGSRRRCST